MPSPSGSAQDPASSHFAGLGVVAAAIENRAKEVQRGIKAMKLCAACIVTSSIETTRPQSCVHDAAVCTAVLLVQIGLAIIDLSSMRLRLMQYVEISRSYSLTA